MFLLSTTACWQHQLGRNDHVVIRDGEQSIKIMSHSLMCCLSVITNVKEFISWKYTLRLQQSIGA